MQKWVEISDYGSEMNFGSIGMNLSLIFILLNKKIKYIEVFS